MKAWLSIDSIVTVPTVYMFDRKRSAIIMEDCGEDCLTLKEFLRQGKGSSEELLEDIGYSLGEFAGCLHRWGRKNPTGMLDFFGKNEQAKKMATWSVYGRLASTLNGENTPTAMSDPLIEMPEGRLEAISKVALEMTHSIDNARDCVSTGFPLSI